VADWEEVEPSRWEAPIFHRPGELVRVDSKPALGGGLRMSVRCYRTAWRRVRPDEIVESLDSAAARRVFDSATTIAAAR